MELQKRCPHCKKELPLSAFYTTKEGKPYTYCKECTKQIKQEYVKKRKERIESEIAKHNLEAFSSRELILELRRRGYKGELYFQQKVKI